MTTIRPLHLLSFVFPLLCLPLISGAKSADWQAKPTGREPNTIVFYTFEVGDYARTTPNEAKSNDLPAAAFATKGVKLEVDGKFGHGFEVLEPTEGDDVSRFGYIQLNKGDIGDDFSGDLTVDLWYKPNSAYPAGDNKGYSLLVDNQYSSKTGFSLSLLGGGQELRASVGNGEDTLMIDSAPLVWEAGEWYHVAMSYDSKSGEISLYRNGVEIAKKEQSGFGPIVAYSGNLRVGNRLGSIYHPTPGVYDNFRVSSVVYDFAR